MSEQIDWSKAPDSATGYLPESCRYFASWVKPGFSMRLVDQDKWVEGSIESVSDLVIQRPATPSWSGEGMPPVGVVCEIAASTEHLKISHPEGTRVKVYATFTDDRGVELAAFVDELGMVAGVAIAKCFRPIRTPEQIAADEREAAVNDMHAIYMKGAVHGGGLYAIYDAGYRKEQK